MKAVVISEVGKIEIQERPMPTPQKGEALLKILHGGICGSDLGAYRGLNPYISYPRVPGHEFSAEIVEVEDNDLGLKKGMLVTANPYFNCGECYSCQRGFVNCCETNQTMGVQREGGFSEYITMPMQRIIPSGGLDAETLALIEPFAISYHGIKRAEVKAGEKVLVMGAGTIGILAMEAAKLAGAKVYVSDISQGKLDLATEFGADGTILNSSPEDFTKGVETATDGNGFDVVVEAAGLASTFQNALDSVAFRGRIIQIGVSKQTLDFDFTTIQRKELAIFGSRNAVKEDFEELIALVSENQLDLTKIVTARFPYTEGAEAFDYLDNNLATNLKIMLTF